MIHRRATWLHNILQSPKPSSRRSRIVPPSLIRFNQRNLISVWRTNITIAVRPNMLLAFVRLTCTPTERMRAASHNTTQSNTSILSSSRIAMDLSGGRISPAASRVPTRLISSNSAKRIVLYQYVIHTCLRPWPNEEKVHSSLSGPNQPESLPLRLQLSCL